MDYWLFLLTLLHVLAGMLFVGLPVVVCAGVWLTGGRAWSAWRMGLQQSLMAGLIALAGGLLIAGFRWDSSFERAWETVGTRWIFGFIEFAFSAGLVFLVVVLCPHWPTQRWRRMAVVAVLFVAATNAWYHFPALMVVSREIRLQPELTSGLEGSVVRQILFSPAIFWRWFHLAIGCVMWGAVWARFLVGCAIEQGETCPPAEFASDEPFHEVERWFGADRFLRQMVWLSLFGLWSSGLAMALHFSSSHLSQILALGSGHSNNLMIGILAANIVGLKTLVPEGRPSGLNRFTEVGLMIGAITAMLVG